MNQEQARALLEASSLLTGWPLTILSLVLTALVAGVSAYLGAYLRQRGQYAAMRGGVEEITRLVKGMEYQVKSRSEFLDKILLERYQLIREINRRLEFVKYNYERLRKGANTELRIDKERGETFDLTELIQMLELNRAILGDDFYTLLRQKYDQVIRFWNHDLDWPNEFAQWDRCGAAIQSQMTKAFGFSEARLFAPVATSTSS